MKEMEIFIFTPLNNLNFWPGINTMKEIKEDEEKNNK